MKFLSLFYTFRNWKFKYNGNLMLLQISNIKFILNVLNIYSFLKSSTLFLDRTRNTNFIRVYQCLSNWDGNNEVRTEVKTQSISSTASLYLFCFVSQKQKTKKHNFFIALRDFCNPISWLENLCPWSRGTCRVIFVMWIGYIMRNLFFLFFF